MLCFWRVIMSYMSKTLHGSEIYGFQYLVAKYHWFGWSVLIGYISYIFLYFFLTLLVSFVLIKGKALRMMCNNTAVVWKENENFFFLFPLLFSSRSWRLKTCLTCLRSMRSPQSLLSSFSRYDFTFIEEHWVHWVLYIVPELYVIINHCCWYSLIFSVENCFFLSNQCGICVVCDRRYFQFTLIKNMLSRYR